MNISTFTSDPKILQEQATNNPPFPVATSYNDLPLPMQTEPFTIFTKGYPLSSFSLLQQPDLANRLILPVSELLPLSPPFQMVQIRYEWYYRQVMAEQFDSKTMLSAPYSYGVPEEQLQVFSAQLGVSVAELAQTLSKLAGGPIPINPYTKATATYGVEPKGDGYTCGVFEVWQVVGVWTLLGADNLPYPTTPYYSEKRPGIPFAIEENQLVNPWDTMLVYCANFKEK